MGRIRRSLHRFYRALARVLVPGLENSQYAYARALRAARQGVAAWLDLGCGQRLFPEWMRISREDVDAIQAAGVTIVGIDRDHAALRRNTAVTCPVQGDAARLPFRDGSFDLVTANMVVEHVADPIESLREIRRALVPGGRFVLHTPNLLNPLARLSSRLPQSLKNLLVRLLEGRCQQDVYPTLYRMNTPGRIRTLAAECGFEVEEIRLVDTTASTVMLGPLVVVELVWIRLLRYGPFRSLKTNLIVVLRKPAASE